MPELAFKQTTLRFPEPLWEQVENVAKAQKREANQVVEEALTDYISNHTPKPFLTPTERKAFALKKLYERAARNRRAFAQAVAEGKIHPLPKDIPLEQVWEALSGIKDSLAAEIIKEREEGW
jgi:hypothetical protein